MTIMTRPPFRAIPCGGFRAPILLLPLLLLAGCTAMTPAPAPSQDIFVLETDTAIPVSSTRHDLVLAVGMMHARPGFDTLQMAYTQRAHELRYFVTSRWADLPAHMLEPLLLQALEQTGSFRAVVPTPATVLPDLQLETELVQLRQNFITRPSRVQLTVRARLIDVRHKRVLAVKAFEETEEAGTDDAYGGVEAIHRALPRLLKQLADFTVNEAAPRANGH